MKLTKRGETVITLAAMLAALIIGAALPLVPWWMR